MFHIKLMISFILIYTISLTAFAEESIIPTHVPAIKVATGEPGKNVGPGIFLEEGAGLSFDISVFSMGHEVGNGGFAFDKSIIVLQAAADELIEQIRETDYPMFEEFPERREILLEVLPFERLEQYLLLSAHNNGNPLWLGYDINPRKVMVFQLFYMAFWRYKDKDFTETVQEIKQLLLHEASHIWGFNQEQAREFSQDCLNYLNNPVSDFVKTSDQVFIQRENYCSCLRGESIDEAAPQCAAQCAGTYSSEPTLYVHAITSPEVYLHPEVETLRNWCTKELGGVQAFCRLEAVDDMGNEFIIPIAFLEPNKFYAPLVSLTPNKHYLLRLVETVSGATSNNFHLKWVLPGATPAPEPASTPSPYSSIPNHTLRIMNIAQYACINRAGESLPDYDWLLSGATTHYYFPQNDRPPTLSSSDTHICHDPSLGVFDSPLFNRLEEIPGFFGLWDVSDLRFNDLDDDGNLDINNIIQHMLLERGFPQDEVPQVFSEFSWKNSPMDTADESSWSRLGFFMKPWLKNDGSGYSFCPTRDNYENPNSVVFNVIGDLVGYVNTEAIYLSTREPDQILDNSGALMDAPVDFIIIRESLLKRIGFFYDDGHHYQIDDSTMNLKAVHFYWPADINDPYVKKQNQRLYTISLPSAASEWFPSSTISSDRRLGCVPEIPLSGMSLLHEPLVAPTTEECQENGFDCVIDSQCVSDGMLRSGVATDSVDYQLAMEDIFENPSAFMNWPQLFYVCPE